MSHRLSKTADEIRTSRRNASLSNTGSKLSGGGINASTASASMVRWCHPSLTVRTAADSRNKQMVVKEIVATEMNYVAGLATLSNAFLLPMKKKGLLS